MLGIRITACAISALGILVSGCSNYWSGTRVQTKSVDSNQVLVTTADVRGIFRVASPGKSITCAEPSPDVAKIATASFSGDLAASASSIGSVVSPEIAMSLAMSRSEALAQLGQRLATIQLLRDGMYRACEAYANGAIDKASYAVMLGRYDDVMITMLLGEFAANSTTRFGPVFLGSNSSATGSSTIAPDPEKVKALGDELTKAKAAQPNLDSEVTKADAAYKADASEANKTALTTATENSNKNKAAISSLEAQIAAAKGLSVYANTQNATQTPTVTVIQADSGRTEVAAAMTQMQQNYLDDLSLDSLVIACIEAEKNTPLADFCVNIGSHSGILQLTAGADVLGSLLRGVEAPDASLKAKIDALLAAIKALDSVKAAASGQPTQP